MKSFAKFIFSILVVVGIFLVLDFIAGNVLDRVSAKNHNFSEAKTYYSINEVKSPLLIIGSSRAAHHYIPEVIKDSLGMDAYNLGRDGCFLSYNCAIINTILDRYTPQAVLFEISRDEMYQGQTDWVQGLHPYYHLNPYIKGVIDANEGSSSKYKILLNSYRYNRSALKIVGGWIIGGPESDSLKGLLPLYTTLRIDTELKVDSLPKKNLVIDDYKVQLFENTIRRLKECGVDVYCFDSPYYYLLNPARNITSEQIMKDICTKYDVSYFDNRQIPEFLNHPEYFYDRTHLNYDGAKVYTEYVLNQIRIQ